MNIYDETPYPSLVYTDTHPNKLATLATLHGVKPTAIEKCRVLELGCGDGTNLIAIAQSLPQAICIGIDLSANQINDGQKVIDSISLNNITLKQLNFNAIDESLGKFDYIIAHGIYSWVPLSMQDIVLNLIKKHLTANGIAYISYNVYPGWHTEDVVRNMMMYHLQQLPALSAKEQVTQAKGILQFITSLRQSGNDSFDILLKEKSQQFQMLDDNYLSHDFLEPENHPVYFQQFVDRITQHDLTYITDIEFRHYLMLDFPPQVTEPMQKLFQNDFFKQEQYLDFFYHRTLRRSILCQQVAKRPLDWQRLFDCYVASNTDELVDIQHPITKTAISHLREIYPQRLTFRELFKLSKRPAKNLSSLRNNLAQELLHLYCLELVELHAAAPTFTTKITKYPVASPLARHLTIPHSINLRCEFVELSAIAKKLLPHLNGKNTQKDLLNILVNVTEENLKNALLEIAQNALLMK